jgi:hypothetical protein
MGLKKTLAINDMNNLLADFYANVRNLEGEFYSKSTMIAIRQGIRRYLQEPPKHTFVFNFAYVHVYTQKPKE